MKLVYYFLAITMACAPFVKTRLPLYGLMLGTSFMAYYQGIMSLTGAACLLGLAGISYLYFNHPRINKFFRLILFLIISAILAALVLHDLPGFYNSLVVERVIVGNSSRFFSIYLNFDKVMGGLIIYTGSKLIFNEKKFTLTVFKKTIQVLLACLGTIILPALLIRYVKVDLKLPDILTIWVLNNLFFVSFAEEAIFRGFLQHELKKYIHSKHQHFFFVLVLSSILFGLSHYRYGTIYICFAAVCGIFYGYAYEKTKRILSAILVHFGFNLTHLLVFTYPY